MQQVPSRIRSMFIPREGYKFLNVDFSAIELYLLGVLASEKGLIEPYEKGEDIHAPTMQRLGINRDPAKMVNFSLVYGAGSKKLSRKLHVAESVARSYVDTVLSRFPGLQNFKATTLFEGRKDGYFRGIGARKRRLPDIYSNDKKLRSRAERQAINFRIQASAAWLIKRALIKTRAIIGEAIPLVQVHDSVLYEVPRAQAEEVQKEIERIFQTCANGLKPRVESKLLERWE